MAEELNHLTYLLGERTLQRRIPTALLCFFWEGCCSSRTLVFPFQKRDAFRESCVVQLVPYAISSDSVRGGWTISLAVELCLDFLEKCMARSICWEFSFLTSSSSSACLWAASSGKTLIFGVARWACRGDISCPSIPETRGDLPGFGARFRRCQEPLNLLSAGKRGR